MKKTNRRLQFVLLMCLILPLDLAATADSPRTFPWSLSRYQHTAFTKRDGAPQGATELVVTTDGYLWSNGAKGLFRFDGQRFEEFTPRAGERLLSSQVARMFAPKSGGLWISYDVPGISFIHDGHITNYDNNDGWGRKRAEFLEDRDGNIMAYAHPSPGLMKLVDHVWKQVDDEPAELRIIRVSQDASFNIWAIDGLQNVLVMREGETRFTETGTNVKGGNRISAVGQHTIYVSTIDHVVHRFADEVKRLTEIGAPIPLYSVRIIADKRGMVWAGTPNDGIHFLGPLSEMQVGEQQLLIDDKLTRSDGLTGNFATAFEDRGGNVWVTTEGGLDRFVPSAFSQLSLPTGIAMVNIAPGAKGDVWIGSDNFKVVHLADKNATQTEVPWMALAAYENISDGTVYFATRDGLWQLAPDTPVQLAELPVKGGGLVQAITRDPTGKIWVSFRSKAIGLARLNGSTWETHLAPVSAEGPLALATDASGRIWAGFAQNRLASIDGETIKEYSEHDGLLVGEIKLIADHDSVLWVAGDGGLQFRIGDAFRTLHLAGGHLLTDVSGFVFDTDNNLWIHTLEGLFRIPKDAVRQAVADPEAVMPYRLLVSNDGAPGIPAQTHTLPTIKLGSDGRLWITGQFAAAWLDPRELPSEPHLANPIVERISDGARAYDTASAELHLPLDARNLQIDYTTPELAFSERVRFQYRLTGFDEKWQEAGDRRRAFYPQLPSGNFRFDVRSTIEGQSWSDQPISSVPFTIAPNYFETWWFRSIMLAAVLLTLWWATRLQVLLATSRVRSRMQIRSDEREAIARDLHDTLLQSAHALVLQLGLLMESTRDMNLKEKLERLRNMSKDAVVEGRDKVSFLRAQQVGSTDMIAMLVRIGTRLSSQFQIRFDTKVQGTPRSLKQTYTDELVPLVSELLTNAFRHSRANSVILTLSFGFWKFIVTVVDDGVGIQDAATRATDLDGHWGIKGAIERAARIGARITFHELPTGGTKVQASLASRLVYSNRKASSASPRPPSTPRTDR